MADVLVLTNRSHEPFNEFVEKIFEKAVKEFDIAFVERGPNPISTAASFIAAIVRHRPAILWVIGSGFASVFATVAGKLVPATTVVFFHNDFTYLHMRDVATHDVSRLRLLAERIQEGVPLHLADVIVTMSDYHESYLRQKGLYQPFLRIPHGVDINQFHPTKNEEVRTELGIDDQLAVGIIATFNWSDVHDIGYGWSLVEALQHLDDEPVIAAFIGGGPGVDRLQERAEELGVTDSVVFTGRVPHYRVPAIAAALDVGILVLTNHPADMMKPTMKLPEYLASGMYVVADDHGVASTLLDEEAASLLPYEGLRDEAFPERLADELRHLVEEPARLERGARHSREVAESHFAYEHLQERVRDWLREELADHR